MTKWKKALILILFTLSFATLFSFFYDKNTFLLTFINTTFILALFYFLIGGFLFVIEGGFFNVLRYGFKKMFKSNNRKQAALIEEAEGEMGVASNPEEILYRRYTFSLTRILLISGLSLVVITTLWSFFLI